MSAVDGGTLNDRPRGHLPGPVVSLPGWSELAEPVGTALLASAAAHLSDGVGAEHLGQRLRRENADPDLVAAVLTVTSLRGRASDKFGPVAQQMLFTQSGLEQASRHRVADLHAARFTGCKTVADLGCGLGAESLAFLRAGLGVRAVELDPLTAEFARHNLGVEAARILDETGNESRFEVLTGDATTVGIGEADGVFLDPARRTSGHRDTKRLTSSADYSPSLDFAFQAVRSVRAGGVKLGPGLDRELIPDDAEAQWVSVDGQLVEMGLWFGDAARPGVRRAATVIRRSAIGHSGAAQHASDQSGPSHEIHELLAAADSPDVETRELGEYLYEPDGSVIRARLIGLLAETLDAGMLHDGIAYLTADRPAQTPFAQGFRIIEELPSGEKALRRALTERGVGRLEIKKRGVDVDPAALRTRLRLKGPQSATLILSRSAGRHVALLAERLSTH